MSMNVEQRQITDHGQVRIMKLPAGWIEAQVDRKPFDIWTMRTFHPVEKPQVRLSFYYRGGPVSLAQSENFCQLLAQPPHDLSPEELWDIQQVLRDAAIPGVFEKTSSSTLDWNGKRVVAIEGRWPGSQEDSLTILIDADGTGAQVQEIVFAAPIEDYQRYRPATSLRDTPSVDK